MQDFELNYNIYRLISFLKDSTGIIASIVSIFAIYLTGKVIKNKPVRIVIHILLGVFLIFLVVSLLLLLSQKFNLEKVFEEGYYFGETMDKKADGNGRQYNEDKMLIYKGGFSRNRYEGEGTWYVNYQDEDNKWIRYLRYEGEFSDGLYNGYGSLYRVGLEYDAKKPLLEYQGEFIDNKFNGHGIYYEIPDKEGETCRYEGDFLEGEYHGEGQYYINDRLIYEGSYAYGVPSGSGKSYTYTEKGNIFKYEGDFCDGLPNGHGRIFVNDELIYDGGFYSGAIQGEGRIFLNGDQVERGYFSEATKSGTLDYFIVDDAVRFFNGGFCYQTA